MRLQSAFGTLIIVVALATCSYAQEKFPSWVPVDAVQAAKDHWLHMAKVKEDAWQLKPNGISNSQARAIVLTQPRIIIDIDYEGYSEDKSILEHFKDSNGRYSSAFRFSIYSGDRYIGEIEVFYRNGLWRMGILTTNMGKITSDLIMPAYSTHIPSEDVLIYQKFEGALFIVERDNVTEVFEWDDKGNYYKSIDPIQHMIEKKNRIIDWKNSESYDQYMSPANEQDNNLRVPLSPSEEQEIIGANIPSICCPSQEHTYWCWAACIESILLATGQEVTQCAIVCVYKTLSGVSYDCCGAYDETKCNLGLVYCSAGATDGVCNVLNEYEIGNTYLNGRLTAVNAKASLAAGSPFFMATFPMEGPGHSLIAVGFSKNLSGELVIEAVDPDPSKCEVFRTYAGWAEEPAWVRTLVINVTLEVDTKDDPLCYLDYFHPIAENGTVSVKWKPILEKNTTAFIVQKRIPGQNIYESIGLIAADGDNANPSEYSFTDISGTPDDIYRLVELEGTETRHILAVSEVLDENAACYNPLPALSHDLQNTRAQTKKIIEEYSFRDLGLKAPANTLYDWLVIYPDSFSEEVDDLVTWRSQTGYTPYPISVEDIADVWEMSVKEFIEYMWLVQGHNLRYIVIVGDGENIIPIDHYYDGIGDPDIGFNIYQSDVSLGDVDNDGLCDIAVGRIPASNEAELTAYINKLVTYETTPPGDWADDISYFVYAVNENNCNGELANAMATDLTNYLPSDYSLNYNYVDDDNIADFDLEERRLIATQDVESGKSLIFGFGTVSKSRWFVRWEFDLGQLSDGHPLPFMLGSSCHIGHIFDGYWGWYLVRDYMFHPTRGIAGAFAPSSNTWQVGNYEISKNVLQYLYNWSAPSTGYACMHAQRQVMEKDVGLLTTARSYVFLGDPAVKIAGTETSNTDYSASIQISPNGDLYEYGKPVNIVWSCDGAPWKMGIDLIEVTSGQRMIIRTFDQYEQPDLASGSIQWTMRGISPDYENHIYRLQIVVWDLAHNYVWATTSPFDVCEEIPRSKPGDRPFVQASYIGEDGKDYNLPLPGLMSSNDNNDFKGSLLLSETPRVTDGTISLTVRGHESQISINSVELVVVDVPQENPVYSKKLEPAVKGSDIDYMSADRITEPAIIKLALAADKYSGAPDEAVDIADGDVMAFNFQDIERNAMTTRSYILKYSGTIVDEISPRDDEVPSAFNLINPYPNPFNPTTAIEFHLPVKSSISLDVYDSAGILITTLKRGYVDAGVHTVVWNGKNVSGRNVSSGIYFCRLKISGEKDFTRKMILLR